MPCKTIADALLHFNIIRLFLQICAIIYLYNFEIIRDLKNAVTVFSLFLLM